MNAPVVPFSPSATHGDETLIRRLLRDMDKTQQAEVMSACGWKDVSSISQIVTGNAGIKLDQLDALLGCLGLSIQENWYMEYLGRGNSIGANCCKARASMGYCKARQ